MKRKMTARLLTVAATNLAMVGVLLPPAATAQVTPPADRVQVGPDVLLRHDDPAPTRGRDSVGVAVDPDDPDHLVLVNADLYSFECEFHTSFDGGVTWSSGKLRAPEAQGFSNPPCSSIGHGTSSFDGSVVFGSGDNVYVAFGSKRSVAEGQPAPGLSALVAKSTDGGRTFAVGVEALPGTPTNNNRFPEVAAQVRPGQPDRLVVAASDRTGGDTPTRDAAVAVSEDGGQTWSARVTANAATEPAQEVSSPVVGPDGTFYVAWRDFEFEGEIRAARSTDGLVWESFHVADVVGYRAPDRDFTCCNYPRIAVDPNNGTVYITYTVGPPPATVEPAEFRSFDHFIHPDMEVIVTRSTDRGQTWSAPVRVNDETPEADGNTFHQIRHSAVSVAPNGRVDVTWHDRRHWYEGCQHTHAECDEARLGDTYYAFSTDGGQTFSKDIRITDRSQNNDVGSDYRLGVYWDFPPVSVPLGNDEIFVAWMDSRQGNWDTDALDIYYTKVALDADPTAATPTRLLPASSTPDLSVALGRHAYPGGSEATLVSTFATRAWTHVVVVNEDDAASALVGGVLARYRLGPVLATPAAALPAAVVEEVERMRPLGAFIVGGTGAVSSAVRDQLVAAGIAADAVTRFEGASPADVAAQIAAALDQRTPELKDQGIPAFDAVTVVNPDTDEGVAAAALAAARRLPVLFVGQDSVPQATADALTALDIDASLVVGGTTSISDAVMAQLPNPKRLAGTDAAGTSRAVAAEALARGMPANVVYVADSGAPMDAALVGAAVGRITGLFLLTPGGTTDVAVSLATLGVASEVDRIIAASGLAGRGLLTWACPDGTVPSSGFVDVAGNVHAAAINCAAWFGLATGGPAGRPATQFGPELPVRRDQMASFIARMIDHANPGLLPAASGGNPFPCDLAETNPHFDAIRRLAAAGIVSGGPGGSSAECFGPAQSVRRDQMATFIHAAISAVAAPITTDETFFTDIGGAHAANVNSLASEGIVLGRTATSYAPAQSVLRDQMTSFLGRALDFLVQHEEAQRPEVVVR